VEVDVVSVTAVVFDKQGKFVRGLGPKDVELLENGVKQEVSYFREASSQGSRPSASPSPSSSSSTPAAAWPRTCAFCRRRC